MYLDAEGCFLFRRLTKEVHDLVFVRNASIELFRGWLGHIVSGGCTEKITIYNFSMKAAIDVDRFSGQSDV